MDHREDVHGGNVYRHVVSHDFSTSINPFPLPEEVYITQRNTLSEMNRYPDPDCSKLREVLRDEFNLTGIVFGNGATELLYALMRTVPEGKQLLTVAPTFSEYEKAAKSCGIQTRKIYLTAEEDFYPSNKKQQLFLDEMDDSVGIVILCNPNNPTGYLYDKSFLEAVCRRGKEMGITVCLDECYCELVDAGNLNVSMRSELAGYPNLLILRSFTKTFGLPGYRIGYLLGHEPRMLRQIQSFLPPWNVSQAAQEVALCCLRYSDREQIRSSIALEREFLYKELLKIPFMEKVYDSCSCFLMFKAGADVYDRLLERRVLIRDLSGMDGLSEGYYRVGVKTREENLILLQAMRDLYQ